MNFYVPPCDRNDLCIFKLEDDVSQEIGMSSFPCLPPKGYEFEPGTKCYVAGWGLTSADGMDKNYPLFNKIAIIKLFSSASFGYQNYFCIIERST